MTQFELAEQCFISLQTHPKTWGPDVLARMAFEAAEFFHREHQRRQEREATPPSERPQDIG